MAATPPRNATPPDLSPTPTLTDVQRAEYQYRQPELSLKMDKIFEETNGKDVRDVISEANLGKGELQGEIDKCRVKCKLAPVYGPAAELETGPYKTMDDAIILMLWVSLKDLAGARNRNEDLTFDKVENMFILNHFLQPDNNKSVNAKKVLNNKESVNLFDKVLGRDTYDTDKTDRMVQDWFEELIEDADVLKDIETLIKQVQDLIARTNSEISLKLGSTEEQWEKTLVDVGVFRFPDFQNPCIRVYHVRLSARALSDRGPLKSSVRSSVAGEYRLREYTPRRAVIKLLSKEAIQLAASECERAIKNRSQVTQPEFEQAPPGRN